MARTQMPGDERQEDKLNTSQQDYDRKFNEIAKAETEGTFNDTVQNYNQDADSSQEDTNIAKLRDQEEDGAGEWRNLVSQKVEKVKSAKSPLQRRFAIFGLAGLLGGGSILGIGMFFMLTMKGNMFLDNITSMASQVPGYAMEQRTEYLMTRLLAIHLLRIASDTNTPGADVDAKLVFCKNASISCSLFATYGADYFDKQIDVSIKERLGDNARIVITPKGRNSLGGNARSWEMTISRSLGDGQFINTVQQFNSNSEAKQFLKKMVNNNLKTKSIATRYIARLILMKKYGITHWRGFEKTSNQIDEWRTKMKATLIKNTSGVISKRMGMYFACLSDPAVCDQMRASMRADAGKLQEKIDELKANDGDQKQIDKLERALESVKALSTGGDVPDSEAGEAGSSTKKIIMKRLLAVSSGVGVVLLVDSIFKAIGAIDENVIDQVVADIRKTTYTMFAFGDEVGVVPNISKLKAGDMDLEAYGVLMDLLKDAEQSPLMQYENGVMSADKAASSTFSRQCEGSNGPTATTLNKGQLICPEREMVAQESVTAGLTSLPGWDAVAAVAGTWNSSIGVGIDWVSDFIGSLGPIQWISDAIGTLTGPVIEWLMGLFFIPPNVGFEASGADNYDALSGAIRESENAMAENGVGIDGSVLGIGGTVMSNGQVSAIENYYKARESEDFANQPLVAKIFNPHIKYSFAQQFVARIPTSLTGIIKSPVTGLGYAIDSSGTSVHAASDTTINPHNLPRYGYSMNDPVLTADPNQYTDSFCTTSAAAREESYQVIPEVSPIPIYTKSDPCALEKTAVGIMLQAEGVTNDPNSLEQPGAEAEQPAGGTRGDYPRPDNVVDRQNGWSTKPGADYSSTPCDPRTEDQGVRTSPSNGSIIRLCRVSNEKWPGGSESSVASIISRNVVDMFEDAHAAGVPIGISSAFRSNSTTEHGKGLAMDLKSVKTGFSLCFYAGGSKAVWDACDQGSGSEHPDEVAAFKWLRQNGASYGFHNLAGTPLWEPWHWSTSGN